MEKHNDKQSPGLTFCICGGGSLAHAVTAVLSASPLNKVHVLSRNPGQWSGTLSLNYRDEVNIIGRIERVSDNPAEVIPGADIIFIAVPHAYREEVLLSISPYVSPHAWVGALPGFAGFAWTARHYLADKVRLFGFQRVPYVCKKEVYGSRVYVTGIRPRNYIAALPAEEVNSIAGVLQKTMNLYIIPVSNYLNICFSRSNSVFHPARLYGLCSEWNGDEQAVFKTPFQFYSDWDERSSEMFFGLDAEIQAAAALVPLDLLWAQPVLQHYEVAFPADLTDRIRNIEALANRPFPLVPVKDGYIPDRNSYYFTEDIAYGLTTLKAIFTITGISSPVTDKILEWGQRILNASWINQTGELITTGPEMPWPQRFGIKTTDELAAFCIKGTLK